jgi:hypothetical protein
MLSSCNLREDSSHLMPHTFLIAALVRFYDAPKTSQEARVRGEVAAST